MVKAASTAEGKFTLHCLVERQGFMMIVCILNFIDVEDRKKIVI
jgi:hypothetical protein